MPQVRCAACSMRHMQKFSVKYRENVTCKIALIRILK